jgi:hypothetical protein
MNFRRASAECASSAHVFPAAARNCGITRYSLFEPDGIPPFPEVHGFVHASLLYPSKGPEANAGPIRLIEERVCPETRASL